MRKNSKQMNIYLKNLIFSLRENKTQNIEENKAFANFIKSIENDEKFKKFLDYSLLVSALNSIFVKYEKVFKKEIEEKDVNNFEDEIYIFLKNNHYMNGLILFTNRIHTKKDIKLGNFKIYGNLVHPLRILTKFNFINTDRISKKNVLNLLDHGEKTRNFKLEQTAIVHTGINSINKYQNSANLYVQYLLMVLKILTNDLYHKNKKFKSVQSIQNQYFPKHILILSEIFNNSNYQPIHSNLIADIYLDEIQTSDLKTGKSILNILLKDNYNELEFRYYKSLYFFTKGLDQRYISLKSEGFALEILFYFISLEILLLFGQKEKKYRIAKIASTLIEKDALKKQKIENTLNNLYNQRSDFVHEGKDFYNKFEASTFKNLSEQKVNDLRDIVQKLLLIFPKIHNNLQKKNNVKSEISLWKEKLETIWLKEKND